MNAVDVGLGAQALEYAAWMSVAEAEYGRLLRLLDSVSDVQWAAPTECGGWRVRDVVAHLAGGAAAAASVPEMLRQAWAARGVAAGPDLVDRMNEVQVRERDTHSPAQLREELHARAARAVTVRRRIPTALLALPLPFGPPLGTRPLGYLMGRIYTRDAWMHRVDISRALHVDVEVTAEHDGRIIEDLVAEWSSTHADPFDLTLDGPAGGHWTRGMSGGRGVVRLDAVEFARILSGRGGRDGRALGEGVLAHRVPF